jgi:hypothetical protein
MPHAHISHAQNITVVFPPGGWQLQTTLVSEALLQDACHTAGAYFCSGGADVGIQWTSNVTHAQHSLVGLLGLCFPPECCGDGDMCDDTNGVSMWAFDALQQLVVRLCDQSSAYCHSVRYPCFLAAVLTMSVCVK